MINLGFHNYQIQNLRKSISSNLMMLIKVILIIINYPLKISIIILLLCHMPNQEEQPKKKRKTYTKLQIVNLLILTISWNMSMLRIWSRKRWNTILFKSYGIILFRFWIHSFLQLSQILHYNLVYNINHQIDLQSLHQFWRIVL